MSKKKKLIDDIDMWVIKYKELIFLENIPFASGNFCDVYRVKLRLLLQPIVLKKAKDKYNNTPNYKNYTEIYNEINIIRTLRHPNIIGYYGTTYNELNEPCILLEYAERGDLEKNIKKLNNNKKLNIAKQICSAIHFLHNCNIPIIHRDIKPDNIYIDINWNAKLSDFGLSRYIESKEIYKMTGYTGALRWMAPEVFFCQEYNYKVDNYSYGLLLYYIFSNGIQPFFNLISKELLQIYLEKKLDFTTNLKFNKIIKFCIEKLCKYNANNRAELSDILQNLNNIKFSFFNCI
jgi:serine/threonine protein kinase